MLWGIKATMSIVFSKSRVELSRNTLNWHSLCILKELMSYLQREVGELSALHHLCPFFRTPHYNFLAQWLQEGHEAKDFLYGLKEKYPVCPNDPLLYFLERHPKWIQEVQHYKKTLREKNIHLLYPESPPLPSKFPTTFISPFSPSLPRETLLAKRKATASFCGRKSRTSRILPHLDGGTPWPPY